MEHRVSLHTQSGLTYRDMSSSQQVLYLLVLPPHFSLSLAKLCLGQVSLGHDRVEQLLEPDGLVPEGYGIQLTRVCSEGSC